MYVRKLYGPLGGASLVAEGLPVSPGAALEVNARGHSVTLDPTRTAANALIGVMPDAITDAPFILRAGETLRVPEGFRKLFIFNAIGWFSARVSTLSQSHSSVSLLVSQREDLADMHLQALTAPRAPHPASVVYRGFVPLGSDPGSPSDSGNLGWADPTPIIPTPGVQRLRVSAIPAPTNPANQLSVAPADFAALIRPYSLTVRPKDSNGFAPTNGAPLTNSWDDPFSSAFLNWGVWQPHSASDMNATPTDQVFDLDLVDNLGIALQVNTLAGTNINGIFFVVEAF